jgi:hypothetical protein
MSERMLMYDALVSADVVADDPDAVAASLVRILGLPEPRANAALEPEGHGFRAIWLRLQPSLTVAPTRIEVIGVRPRNAPHDHIAERIDAQSERPVRTHATVLAGDIARVREHLCRNAVPHRVTPESENFPFPRVWLGVTEDHPTRYDRTVDCGLWLEVVPTRFSGIPQPDDRVAQGPGVHRIAARRFLVTDVDAAARTLERNLRLVADGVVARPAGRTARYVLGNPRSAAIEIVEPTDDSPEARLMADWGPGPATVVVEVGDLDHVAQALAELGVATDGATTAEGDRCLRPTPTATANVPFEFVSSTSPSPQKGRSDHGPA